MQCVPRLVIPANKESCHLRSECRNAFSTTCRRAPSVPVCEEAGEPAQVRSHGRPAERGEHALGRCMRLLSPCWGLDQCWPLSADQSAQTSRPGQAVQKAKDSQAYLRRPSQPLHSAREVRLIACFEGCCCRGFEPLCAAAG